MSTLATPPCGMRSRGVATALPREPRSEVRVSLGSSLRPSASEPPRYLPALVHNRSWNDPFRIPPRGGVEYLELFELGLDDFQVDSERDGAVFPAVFVFIERYAGKPHAADDEVGPYVSTESRNRSRIPAAPSFDQPGSAQPVVCGNFGARGQDDIQIRAWRRNCAPTPATSVGRLCRLRSVPR